MTDGDDHQILPNHHVAQLNQRKQHVARVVARRRKHQRHYDENDGQMQHADQIGK